MKISNLKVGQTVYQKGINENYAEVYKLKIIGFEYFLIHVQSEWGDKWTVNTWDLIA